MLARHTVIQTRHSYTKIKNENSCSGLTLEHFYIKSGVIRYDTVYLRALKI